MHIFLYDENFIYQGEDVVDEYEEMPKNATIVRPGKGLYLPMYNEDKNIWTESATHEYIDSLRPQPPPPLDINILKQQNAVLTKQVAHISKQCMELEIEIKALKEGKSN
ncbi:hypothetical protein [Bacillus altitudinis]|uniref:hypothetical protein n=1 Tax=Bacillus altitudinis TaxID=293387 RepID=UPI001BCE4D9B|nr:hypothetical protein [Bacillus altitudinis]MBS4747539.1 hypothetical protein [Bacillus altitudinis]